MQKAFSILLLSIFFLALYGKIFSYIYCKWQTEITAFSCDCEKKLAADTKDSPDHSPQMHLKVRMEEPYMRSHFITIDFPVNILNRYFNNIVTSLANGFEDPLLRPPVI